MVNIGEHLMNFVTPFFELIIALLNILSIVILVWGVTIAGYKFLRTELTHHSYKESVVFNNFIKNVLGSYILLSLEVLIVADIIESIINPTFEDIMRVAALVVIRTIISYFLHKEIISE